MNSSVPIVKASTVMLLPRDPTLQSLLAETLLDVGGAKGYLTQLHSLTEVFQLGVEEAKGYLELLQSVMELLQLYQECFPTEFQRDQEQAVALIPAADALYSACEANFFRHVDAQYFPLPQVLDWLPDDPFGERVTAYRIPIAEMGFDFSQGGEEQYQELPFGWKLLLYLLGVVDEDWLRACGVYEADDLFALPIARNDEVSRTLLRLRCAVQGGPLSALSLAIQMLYNETDSVWLNVTLEDPCTDAFWSREDMEEIKRQYQLAREIRAKADGLCKWLEENPCKHFRLVTRLWNACARDTPQRGSGPRVMEVPAATFVDGLHFVEGVVRPSALPAQR